MQENVTREKIAAHEANLKRYAWLLTTQLTDLERTFVHKRIAEERFAIEKLLSSRTVPPVAMSHGAAQCAST